MWYSLLLWPCGCSSLALAPPQLCLWQPQFVRTSSISSMSNNINHCPLQSICGPLGHPSSTSAFNHQHLFLWYSFIHQNLLCPDVSLCWSLSTCSALTTTVRPRSPLNIRPLPHTDLISQPGLPQQLVDMFSWTIIYLHSYSYHHCCVALTLHSTFSPHHWLRYSWVHVPPLDNIHKFWFANCVLFHKHYSQILESRLMMAWSVWEHDLILTHMSRKCCWPIIPSSSHGW